MERTSRQHRRIRTSGDTGAAGAGVQSKQDEPSGLDQRAADPRRLEAPAAAADEEDADPLASLPADFAAFSLTQTHRAVRRRQGGALRAAAAVQDAHVHLRRQVPLRPGPLLLRARRVGIEAAAGALVAARVQDEALPLRRLGVPLLCGRPLPVRAHGPRAGVPSRGTRSIPPTQVEELQYLRPPPAKPSDAYKTRMCRYGAGTCPYGVSCSYAHSAVVFRAEKSTLRAVDAKNGSVRAQEELRPREPDEPPGEPTDVVSRLERLRALRDSGSVSAVEFEVLKQQVGASRARSRPRPRCCWRRRRPPPPRCLSPPPPDAYMLPAMAMPPRVVPRPGVAPAAAVRRGAGAAAWAREGAPQLLPRGYGAPPPPYASVPRPPRRRILAGRRIRVRRAAAGPRTCMHTAAAAAAVQWRAPPRARG